MNSQLQGNEYRVPEMILNKIKAKLYTNPTDAEGIKRAKFIIKNGTCSYEQLKRLKNFFDKFNSAVDPIDQFELAGGQEMRRFVEQTLKNERDKTAREKDIKRPVLAGTNTDGMKAQIKNDVINMGEGVEEKKLMNRNALLVIFNDEMKVLLLQRSDYPDQWMPSKWSMVGGKIENGEEPLEAAKREAKEETGLDLDNIVEIFVIQRSEDNVEHLFIAKTSNNEVSLNKENQDYAWVDVNQVKEYDTVPNVVDYIRIAADNKKYSE